MKEKKIKKSIHISKELMKEVAKLAEKESRSANGQMVHMLRKYLHMKGVKI